MLWVMRTISNAALFCNSLEYASQRAIMDRSIEEGRQQHDTARLAVEKLHSQLDEVKQQAVEQLRRAVESRVRETEANVKGLALQVTGRHFILSLIHI